MSSPNDKPLWLQKSFRTVTEEHLAVTPEEFKAIVVWVTHRVLMQAFDIGELTADEFYLIGIGLGAACQEESGGEWVN